MSKIFKTIASIRQEIEKHQKEDKIIGFVPTMGAIHLGHLSLILEAKKWADIVVVSIFINQSQFNNQEDYQKYSRDLEADIKKLQIAKTDILFIPKESEIYPGYPCVSIKLGQLTKQLCGKNRPGHFDAVALIITKLFNIINPNIAIFGEKDFQQLQVIKTLVKNLNFNIKIIAAKTIREESGLALSSRNSGLSAKNKKTAPKIYQILTKIKQKLLYAKNDTNIVSIINNAKQELTQEGFDKVDYLEIAHEKNLQSINKFDKKIKSRIFIAVYLQQIRLIDNLELY